MRKKWQHVTDCASPCVSPPFSHSHFQLKRCWLCSALSLGVIALVRRRPPTRHLKLWSDVVRRDWEFLSVGSLEPLILNGTRLVGTLHLSLSIPMQSLFHWILLNCFHVLKGLGCVPMPSRTSWVTDGWHPKPMVFPSIRILYFDADPWRWTLGVPNF